MGKKNKSSHVNPNAPLYPTIDDAYRYQHQPQPAHNPYYSDSVPGQHLLPPPPYPDLSAQSHNNPTSLAMTRINNSNIGAPQAGYARLATNPQVSRQNLPSVIIQQQPAMDLMFDRKAENYHRNVRKFNSQMFFIALFTIVGSIYARNLYERRPCVYPFTVSKPFKNAEVTIGDVRDAHVTAAIGGLIIIAITLVKFASGRSRSYSCYLFIMSIISFFATLYMASLAYLTFFSPCVISVGELASNAVKTAIGSVSDSLPSPDRGIFNESNVFQYAKDDRFGLAIFCIDFFNFILYLSAFISSVSLC